MNQVFSRRSFLKTALASSAGLRLRHYERQSREFSKYEDVTFTIEGMDTEDKPTVEEADAEEV